MLTLAVASQDNKMEHELCMARELARSPAKLIRLLFHLKNHAGGYYSFHGANGDNFRGAPVFHLYMSNLCAGASYRQQRLQKNSSYQAGGGKTSQRIN